MPKRSTHAVAARYLIKYTVEGFGERETGPYRLAEAEQHLYDIADYEGVSLARIEPLAPTPKTLFDHIKEAP